MRKCKCGGEIVFEKKKTFVIPSVKRGICIKCKKQYELIGNLLLREIKK